MSNFVTFGEIMLRLKTAGHERFFQSPSFEATFGGGEANVAPEILIGMRCSRMPSGFTLPVSRPH